MEKDWKQFKIGSVSAGLCAVMPIARSLDKTRNLILCLIRPALKIKLYPCG
ncbi:hypothetical protein AVDCRST_MAG94-229 [uncultured Leptolyngbya sp.]|uniref:Uncharacterized protein n=1 Tax=uncultured Leptolyngbya sp. TaxID=332963 RepID=A0A6J4K9F2_9CYAN|nr:hypothetical protein AVDCRST_MAG94-229 [uncultured Leptolyngbya sp.]